MQIDLQWRIVFAFPVLWASSWISCGTVDQPPPNEPDDTADEALSRIELVLNGTWEVTEGELSEQAPTVFDRTIPVPGLVTSADPAFENVSGRMSPDAAYWYRTG